MSAVASTIDKVGVNIGPEFLLIKCWSPYLISDYILLYNNDLPGYASMSFAIFRDRKEVLRDQRNEKLNHLKGEGNADAEIILRVLG